MNKALWCYHGGKPFIDIIKNVLVAENWGLTFFIYLALGFHYFLRADDFFQICFFGAVLCFAVICFSSYGWCKLFNIVWQYNFFTILGSLSEDDRKKLSDKDIRRLGDETSRVAYSLLIEEMDNQAKTRGLWSLFLVCSLLIHICFLLLQRFE